MAEAMAIPQSGDGDRKGQPLLSMQGRVPLAGRRSEPCHPMEVGGYVAGGKRMMLLELGAFIWLALVGVILLVLDRLAVDDHHAEPGALEWY